MRRTVTILRIGMSGWGTAVSRGPDRVTDFGSFRRDPTWDTGLVKEHLGPAPTRMRIRES